MNCASHRGGSPPSTQRAALLSLGIWGVRIAIAAMSTALVATSLPAYAQQRVLGTDISYWNCGTSSGGISQANWNTAYSTGNRVFAFLRATRGGTTGLSQTSGTPGNPTQETLSRRYDDPRFVQNLTRATAAGMVVGSYHFARPDVAGNTGTDEADHFIQMAGAWMRPGYMMPMFDQEAGSGSDTVVQFALDFSDRIYAVMQIRPCIYVNGNYSSIFQGATQARRDALAKPVTFSPSVVGPAYPMLWDARYSDNTNPDSIPVQTGDPKNTYTVSSGYYGPWDDYGNAAPWSFWQYASTVSIPGIANVDSGCDADVSHGDIEYVRNYLVPAVWWNDTSGDWSTLANWNCGQIPVAPVTPADQAPPYVTGGLPTARLPGAAGSGPTSGQYDTVVLERPNANIIVTLSSGTHNIRKLYMRETLNLTGGSLTINYDPTYRADNSADVLHGGPISAQFSGPVTISNSASLTVHTLQVDTNRVLTLAGGTLTLNTINLMPHASVPAKILMNGDVSFNALANATAVIKQGSGSGSSGFIDLGGGGARTFNIGNGTNNIDLSIDVPISNGALAKAGAGTMRMTAANTYAGGTTVSAGRLLVNNTSGSGTGTGSVTVNGGVLGGTGTVAGALTVNSGGTISPGIAIGTMTFNNTVILNGTNVMEIDRNGGSPLSDKIVVTAGAPLNYGGTLVVSNAGAALVGGEVFTLFSASSYGGAFVSFNLPVLGAGLNWYTGLLKTNGTLKVNRKPAANLLAFTNTAPTVLQIPFATLIANATDADGDTLTVVGLTLTTTNGIPLATNATSITYSNRASVTDQFSYTITDGRGGSAIGVVSIVNIGSNPSAQFVSQPGVNGGSTLLQFSATPGWTYYLDRSTNLMTWKTIWTNVAPPGGSFNYTDDFHDLGTPTSPAFYRLWWVP
ncbi:MAG: Lysozyme [Pedosphaera sp.]|nr:Lysozyme [Pedosphaera sp.]